MRAVGRIVVIGVLGAVGLVAPVSVVRAADPVAVDDEYVARPGVTLVVPVPGVLGNDSDADDDVLEVVSIIDSPSGVLNVFTDGSFEYTPPVGFTGTETFTYTVSDGFGGSSQATVTIDVVNTDPVAVDDEYVTAPDTPLVVPVPGVLGNDSDADDDVLEVVSIIDSPSGVLNVFTDGSFEYTPPVGFTGTETFTYTVSDGFGGSSQATVSVRVRTNAPPEPTDDSYVVVQGTTLTVSAPGVLGNDADPDDDALEVNGASTTLLGTLVVSTDGSFTYTPDPGELGTETVTISVFDGIDTATSSLRIEIVPPVDITVPSDVTVPNDPGRADAAVAYPAPTSSGGASPVSRICSPASGSFFPLGTTTVTCTATDSTGDTDTDSFTITVVDTEPPVIADGSDLAVTSAFPTSVSYESPAASDNSGVAPVVACDPPSTSTFPVGTTTVTCTATDGAGNTASSAFVVTVTPPSGGSASPTPPPPTGDGPAVPPPTPSGQLPATGGGSPSLLRTGLVLLLLGAAAVVVAGGCMQRSPRSAVMHPGARQPTRSRPVS